MRRKKIAVVGSGVTGLSAAWLLAPNHDVCLYEQAPRLGGHANTVVAKTPDGPVSVDTGFIVYNPLNYPNLTNLFAHLGVETSPSDMSFSVSLDDGALEYGGESFASLFAQKRNVLRARFWSMLRDLYRFYTTAALQLRDGLDDETTLAAYLTINGYGAAFTHDHLLPMASAIWSAPPDTLAQYPIASFVRFFENHGLLKLSQRPQWRTVTGGSQAYVEKLARTIPQIRPGAAVTAITRQNNGVVICTQGESEYFDHVLIATHADQALQLLADASEAERALLSCFRYTMNSAVLHGDPRVMPKRRAVWSSWNYSGGRSQTGHAVCVTYWMNRLQPLPTAHNLFVTLNPPTQPAANSVYSTHPYRHPIFDGAALKAQRHLQSLQGVRHTWFAGSYFGSGFHEDALSAGLDAAEQIGGVRRPWQHAQSAPVRARARVEALL